MHLEHDLHVRSDRVAHRRDDPHGSLSRAQIELRARMPERIELQRAISLRDDGPCKRRDRVEILRCWRPRLPECDIGLFYSNAPYPTM